MEFQDEGWLMATVEDLASVHIAALFGRVQAEEKADGSLLTKADMGMQMATLNALEERFPGVPVLSEEQPPEMQKELVEKAETGVWCLDPLDGTTNFSVGMPLFAVSLAYIKQGEVQYGLVHDPLHKESFSAFRDGGARLNGRRIGAAVDSVNGSPSRLSDCVAVVDFKRLSEPVATRLAVAPPYRSQRSLGSVALDWCWLAARRFQLYLHGGQKLWDYAAGQLIAREAGVAVCLTDSLLEQDCGFRVSLPPRAAAGAVTESLLSDWWLWLQNS